MAIQGLYEVLLGFIKISIFVEYVALSDGLIVVS